MEIHSADLYHFFHWPFMVIQHLRFEQYFRIFLLLHLGHWENRLSFLFKTKRINEIDKKIQEKEERIEIENLLIRLEKKPIILSPVQVILYDSDSLP